ncbi:hypothetical protein [Rhodopila sp.]|jgi:ElaB/YqjD/DUF883 family membrane-anchored ribosome-binding protein|uniref:hypothetical protein n=1 Tax=Rhodopila sp. TaxID=2480087 RepID=UPI002CEF2D89|nr:hypothetical protein [Rhodopila sp.]HVZ06446.1 hypothetical protein [Rhodopila sp.]
MNYTTEARETLSDAQSQIDRLREQVESLMKDRVTPAVAQFAGKAEAAYGTARDTVKQQADVMSGRVRQQPLVAIAVAAAVGWVIGRVMR